jgi:hypothetical protein
MGSNLIRHTSLIDMSPLRGLGEGEVLVTWGWRPIHRKRCQGYTSPERSMSFGIERPVRSAEPVRQGTVFGGWGIGSILLRP